MSIERWIVVRNWERFQHRDAARSTVPPWIKLYVELLDDARFLDLSLGRRLLLMMIWLEYARTRRRLPDDTATLTRRLAQRVLRADLEALSDAGFITFSASEYASEYDSDVARLEKRREETPYPAQSAGDDQAEKSMRCRRCDARVAPRAHCKSCGASPRIAGTNARELSKPSTYERARAFTQNVGWGYEPDVFVDELSRFDLTDEQVAELETLRASLNGDRLSPSSNPFIDDD